MNFGIDTIIKTFDKAFELKKNTVAIIHFAAAFLILFVLSFIGSKIGGGAALIFGLIGLVLFYYTIVRGYYFLTFFALQDLQSGQKPNYPQARTSFNEQKWAAVFTPIVLVLGLVVVGLVEYFLFWVFAQIPVAGSILQALLMLPFFLVNFFFFMVLFFGSGLVFAIMIDQKKGIIDTLKAVLLTIKKRFQSILIYYILSAFLFFLLISITITITALSLMSSGGAIVKDIAASMFSRYGGFVADVNIVTIIIVAINLIVIIAFLLAYLSNVQAGLHSSIYLAAKTGIDYNEKISVNLNQVKNNLKDSLK